MLYSKLRLALILVFFHYFEQKACKVRFGVGHAFSLVWLLLELDLLTIISNRTIQALCGIACRCAYSCNVVVTLRSDLVRF